MIGLAAIGMERRKEKWLAIFIIMAITAIVLKVTAENFGPGLSTVILLGKINFKRLH